mgnify:FL=1
MTQFYVSHVHSHLQFLFYYCHVMIGDGLSVYVKNLPLKITTSELEEEFGKFGALKSGGINLRNQRVKNLIN